MKESDQLCSKMQRHMKTLILAGFIMSILLLGGAAVKRPVLRRAAVATMAAVAEPPTPVTDSIYNPVDSGAGASVGFFGAGWQARSFTVPATMAGIPASGNVWNCLTINVNKVIAKPPPCVYGNNSVPWMGQIVTQASTRGLYRRPLPEYYPRPGRQRQRHLFLERYHRGSGGHPYQPAGCDRDSLSGRLLVLADTASWTLALSNCVQPAGPSQQYRHYHHQLRLCQVWHQP